MKERMGMSKQIRPSASKKPAPANKAGKAMAMKSAKSAGSKVSGKSADLKARVKAKAAATVKAAVRKEVKPKTPAKPVAAGRASVARKAEKTARPASKAGTVKPAVKPAAKVAPAKVAPAKTVPAKAAPSKAPAAKTIVKAPAPEAVRAPVKAAAAPDLKVVGGVKPAKVADAVIAPVHRAVPTEFDGFRVNDYVVYPTHGVGKIVAVEAQEVAGTRLELFVIAFEQEKMTLRVPLNKAKIVGMRVLSSRDTVKTALKTLRGRARIKRTMWSRRAQEYEAKINSGDLLLIAEVVRDLHRAEGQPEQSYSERQIYEAALERLAREVGAVEELDTGAALERVEGALKKAA